MLGVSGRRQDGYLESGDSIVTWCVGHLITMSYPEVYDARYQKWSLDTLPFLPEEFRYEVIPEVKKQFAIVKRLLTREDVDTIYICTDSGREGEYIYRLVDQMAGVPETKVRKRVWIDSQTEEEIRRGVAEAKDWSAYRNLAAAAYLRAKEDYLMGINFSRVLTLRYGAALASFLRQRYTVVSVGRVMTCVLGMVVRRENEIRAFRKTVFYRIFGQFELSGQRFFGEWRAEKGSAYEGFPGLYKNNGFLKKEDAEAFRQNLTAALPGTATLLKNEKKKEVKRPPLLYNLAELQNDCARRFKISPDQTLKVAQELYEKKLVTYPRTDARVLSSAVAKEIQKNLSGLTRVQAVGGFAQEVLSNGSYKGIAKTRYTDDKQITDHYALIPTGQGLGALPGLTPLSAQIYEMIARRFLAVFYPPAVYEKRSLELLFGREHFFAGIRSLVEEGWLKVSGEKKQKDKEEKEKDEEGEAENSGTAALAAALAAAKKGAAVDVKGFDLREGETSPPKRYTSGSMILAMENAGQLIEDEELRSQIKGSGIGTSATRAEILKKLVNNKYLALNGKTQIITPTQLGELIVEAVNLSMPPLLRPELTASWEKGLTMVQQGEISEADYMAKLRDFVARRTNLAAGQSASYKLREAFEASRQYYPAVTEKRRAVRRKGGSK